jgi:hypothetical protein
LTLIVYKLINIIPEQKAFDTFNYNTFSKCIVNFETNAIPYEENDDPKEGEIYGCWIRGFSLITIKVNYKNQYVYTDESILSNEMINLYHRKLK